MRVTQIELDEEELPKSVLVVLSIHEAAMIYKVFGHMRGTDAQELITDGAATCRSICSIGSLFNRFWEDGANGYPNGTRI